MLKVEGVWLRGGWGQEVEVWERGRQQGGGGQDVSRVLSRRVHIAFPFSTHFLTPYPDEQFVKKVRGA